MRDKIPRISRCIVLFLQSMSLVILYYQGPRPHLLGLVYYASTINVNTYFVRILNFTLLALEALKLCPMIEIRLEDIKFEFSAILLPFLEHLQNSELYIFKTD